jgi:hypothetical protein
MMLLPRVSALGATLFMLGVATSAHAQQFVIPASA